MHLSFSRTGYPCSSLAFISDKNILILTTNSVVILVVIHLVYAAKHTGEMEKKMETDRANHNISLQFLVFTMCQVLY